LGSDVAGPTTGVADEVRVPLLSISIGADEMPARMVCRRGARATIATAGGEGARLETAASTVVTSIAADTRRWAVTSSSVHQKNVRGALDGDVKRPSCLATQVVGSREDRPGAELGSFVELVRKTHDAQRPGQVAIIEHREIVIDASEESGDEVGKGKVIDSLDERSAARFVVMEVALFEEEMIVQLKSVCEVKNSFVGPGRDLDRERGVEPRNREFKNAPQVIIAVVRLHRDQVDNRGDFVIGFR